MKKKLNWAAAQRQNYIGERLRNVGTLNRFDLEEEFGISTAQASIDIAHFLKDNPGVAEYDKTLKQYLYQGEKRSDIDHQQHKGAPLTFYTRLAADTYAAAATRDDVDHFDAMKAALSAIDAAMNHQNRSSLAG